MQGGDLQRLESPEREEGDVGDILPRRFVEQRFIRAMGQVVVVLDADDFGDRLGLDPLPVRDVAQADVADEALALEFGEGGQRFGDGGVARRVDTADPEIDDIEHLQAQIPKIIVHGRAQLIAGESHVPGLVGLPARADLGDDDQIAGIRVERLADDLIGDVGAVENRSCRCGSRPRPRRCGARRGRHRYPMAGP